MKIKLNAKDLKKVSPLLRCFKAGAASSKLKHELARAADEAEEHDRGGTIFHLHKAEMKSGWLKEIAPDAKTKKLASAIYNDVKKLSGLISKSKELHLSETEMIRVESVVWELRDTVRNLKHAAARACGAPEDWEHKRK